LLSAARGAPAVQLLAGSTGSSVFSVWRRARRSGATAEDGTASSALADRPVPDKS
jgi:hypothetical protein